MKKKRHRMHNRHRFYKPLRNKNINYTHGQFFVTIQVAHNKSALGAIIGGRSILNELGKGVQEELNNLPLKYPELKLGTYVIMPNHIHAIFDIQHRTSNKENHLGFLVGRFKGVTAFIYGKLRRTGIVPNIGDHLWQRNYWEDLISSEKELLHYERYIRENPKNWSLNRWEAATKYMLGEATLLKHLKRAFVASGNYTVEELKPRRLEISKHGTSVPYKTELVLMSTFTSPQESEVLQRALTKKQNIIWVCPQGIPKESELSEDLKLALQEKRLLFISPQAPGSRLNKKVAAWCNEYVLRQATEIWVGSISPNGMLSSLIAGLHQEISEGTKVPVFDHFR